MNVTVADERLRNQRISGAPRPAPADVVAWLGAVQAQEFAPARWALGLRMPDGTKDAAILRTFDEGRVLRTHVLRPTWHFVPRADIRWMLELSRSRVQRAVRSSNERLGLDDALLGRAASVIERALGDGEYLTRAELAGRLARAGLVFDTQRLAHVLMHTELEGLVCSGPRRLKQFTYAPLAARAPGAPRLTREEALAELTRRFLRSHGPATIRDFVWWSGLTTPDARRGFEMNRTRSREIDGQTYWSLPGSPTPRAARRAHLLPVYDEYLVAYRDRAAVPHGPPLPRPSGHGTLPYYHTVILAGQVAGSWRTEARNGTVTIEVVPARRFSTSELEAVERAAARHAAFLDAPTTLSIARPAPRA